MAKITTLHVDPEVPAKAERRTFTASYKRQILAAADQLQADGASVGALLRKEGLYHQQLSEWRKTRAEFGDAGLAGKKRGRKPNASTTSNRSELAKRDRRIAALEKQLLQAASIIDIQKKVAALMMMLSIDEDATS